MIHPWTHGPEARFDVAQTFAMRQLREGHAQELIHTGKAFDFVFAVVSLDAFLKFVNGKKFHDLRKDSFA